MRNERGIALLVALIIAVLLSLLGLSLTLSSMAEFTVGNEFENHEKALLVADGGLSEAKEMIRGRNLNQLLSTSSTVPVYVSFQEPNPNTWARRNPISPLDARNINFENGSASAAGAMTVTGLLTPAEGRQLGTGRYWAKVTDNNDEAALGLPDNPAEDVDGKIHLRVIGIHQGLAGETVSYGARRKNAVATVEALLKRDMSFDMTSPLTLLAQHVVPNFAGASFLVDGYDHSGMSAEEIQRKGHRETGEAFSGISCLYDNPGLGDATSAVEVIVNSLAKNQEKLIIGRDAEPSVFDDTITVKNSGNPDALNVFDAYFLQWIAARLASVADITYPAVDSGAYNVSGNGIQLGTVDDPKITVSQGSLSISGSATGAGVLLVRGNLEIGGSFLYQGLILVLGEGGSIYLHGSNKGIIGGAVVANVHDGDFDHAGVDLRGNSNFYFSGDMIRLAVSLFPMKLISWREITPEIEPGSYIASR